MSRLFDFRCTVCGTTRTVTQASGEDPGGILCGGCRHTQPVAWWRSRPDRPFAKPDTTGLTFGPRPGDDEDDWYHPRRRTDAGADLESLTVGDITLRRLEPDPPKKAEPAEPKQRKLF